MAIATFSSLIIPLIQLLAGLGAFLIAVKIMSDSMSKLANSGIKRLFQRMDSQKLVGVGVGTITTAIIQSSAVTTVMVIGFVNAGVMTLLQATSVIMGANIGTTITAQIAALGTFDFMEYVTIVTFIGFLIMSIAKSDKWQAAGYMIAGMGLIFLSLQFMKSAVSPLTDTNQSSNPDYYQVALYVQDILTKINQPLLLLLLGIVLTFVLQSSSALTTILISMASAGLVIGGVTSSGAISNGVLYVILGSNIGTCFTSLMATVGTNANAKRSALIHLLFNLFGSLLFFILLVSWKNFMAVTFSKWFPGAYGTQIAMFHTFFNVVCTAIFLPFANLFVKLACIIVPDKGTEEIHETMYIDERILSTPAIAIQQAKKEARRIGDMVMETCDKAIEAFVNKDVKAGDVVNDNLEKIGELNQKVVQYLVNISAQGRTAVKTEKAVSAMYYVMGDILRIGDLSNNVTKYTQRVVDGEVVLSDKVYEEITEMYNKNKELYTVCMDCFITGDKSLLKNVEKRENEIDEMRKTLVERHIERLNKGECNPNSNSVYITLVGNLERMADHMTFIAESINKVRI